jgi:hypothetical protein
MLPIVQGDYVVMEQFGGKRKCEDSNVYRVTETYLVHGVPWMRFVRSSADGSGRVEYSVPCEWGRRIEMKVDGIPAGWKLVRIGRPDAGEWYVHPASGRLYLCHARDDYPSVFGNKLLYVPIVAQGSDFDGIVSPSDVQQSNPAGVSPPAAPSDVSEKKQIVIKSWLISDDIDESTDCWRLVWATEEWVRTMQYKHCVEVSQDILNTAKSSVGVQIPLK